MADDRDDEPGVLGNLPRSRPGHRSDKRGGTSARAKKAPTSRAAPKKRASAPRSSARATPRPRPQPQTQRSAPDPIGQAVQVAGKVAAVGVRTAAGILKRLPRP